MAFYFHDLCVKYRLSASALYYRLRSLRITLSKDANNRSFANSLQLFLLDSLHSHIVSGNPISSFPVDSLVEQFHSLSSSSASFVERPVEPVVEKSSSPLVESFLNSSVSFVAKEFSSSLKSVFSSINEVPPSVFPLEKYQFFQECCDKNWLLSSKDILKLLGKKPRKISGKNYCFISGWKFVFVCKMSNESFWKTETFFS